MFVVVVKSLSRVRFFATPRTAEQLTGSELGKEYGKTISCHPAYLTYMQGISCEMLDWMNHKLESRFPGKISITSDMQMTPFLWQKAKILLKKSERGE